MHKFSIFWAQPRLLKSLFETQTFAINSMHNVTHEMTKGKKNNLIFLFDRKIKTHEIVLLLNSVRLVSLLLISLISFIHFVASNV